MDKEILKRVAREKEQHDDDGVLESSFALKGKFPHIMSSPTMQRCDNDENELYKNVGGKSILDLGCGFGDKSVLMAKHGASVFGIDISDNYIAISKRAAVDSNLEDKCVFQQMDAHSMSFEDSKFDYVVGRGIIHHLDLTVSLSEIKRVLKPGGRAMFVEPLGANPLLKIFRMLTPSARTVDERPLNIQDLAWIQKNFEVHSTYYGLLSAPVAMVTSIILRPFPNNFLLKLADHGEIFLNKFKWLHPFNQYVLLNLKKPKR